MLRFETDGTVAVMGTHAVRGAVGARVEPDPDYVVGEVHRTGRSAPRSSRGIEGGMLRVEVCDDGVGGASPDGTGLVGLADRLDVLGGRLEVDSPPGGGTRLTAAIPLARSDHSASA